MIVTIVLPLQDLLFYITTKKYFLFISSLKAKVKIHKIWLILLFFQFRFKFSKLCQYY